MNNGTMEAVIEAGVQIGIILIEGSVVHGEVLGQNLCKEQHIRMKVIMAVLTVTAKHTSTNLRGGGHTDPDQRTAGDGETKGMEGLSHQTDNTNIQTLQSNLPTRETTRRGSEKFFFVPHVK